MATIDNIFLTIKNAASSLRRQDKLEADDDDDDITVLEMKLANVCIFNLLYE